MPIQFSCTCGKLFTVPDIHAGKNLKCKSCDAVNLIPNVSNSPKAQPLPARNPTTNNPLPSNARQAANPKENSPARKNSNQTSNEDSESNDDNEDSDEELEVFKAETIECPNCEEEILSSSIKCKYCKKLLDNSDRSDNYDSSQIKKTNVWIVVILMIFTFGIYELFFIHRVFKEMNRRGFKKISSFKAVVYFFIPLFNIYWQFAVWQEMGQFFNAEYFRVKAPSPKVGLISNWPFVIILNILTLGYAAPIVLILVAIAGGLAQNLFNKLPNLSEEQEKYLIKYQKKSSDKAKYSLFYGCCSFILGPLTAIPAIIIGHLAIFELKKRKGLDDKSNALAGLIMGYFALLVFIIAIISIDFSPVGRESKKISSNAQQLRAIRTYSETYQLMNNKPVQTLNDLLSLPDVEPSLLISASSKNQFVLFSEKSVSKRNYSNWDTNGKLFAFEYLPNSKGMRMVAFKNGEVKEIPEIEFDKLFKEEEKKYSRP